MHQPLAGLESTDLAHHLHSAVTHSIVMCYLDIHFLVFFWKFLLVIMNWIMLQDLFKFRGDLKCSKLLP